MALTAKYLVEDPKTKDLKIKERLIGLEEMQQSKGQDYYDFVCKSIDFNTSLKNFVSFGHDNANNLKGKKEGLQGLFA